MVALSKQVKGLFSPQEMEAKAIALSLSWATDVGLPMQTIQTNALTVAQFILRLHLFCSPFGDLLSNITRF